MLVNLWLADKLIFLALWIEAMIIKTSEGKGC